MRGRVGVVGASGVFLAHIVLGHLQVEQRRARPHGFADLQVVLLSGEARRTLVVWRQHFDVHRGNGRPAAGGQRRGENVSRQTGETPLRWMERTQSRVTVRTWRRMWRQERAEGQEKKVGTTVSGRVDCLLLGLRAVGWVSSEQCSPNRWEHRVPQRQCEGRGGGTNL